MKQSLKVKLQTLWEKTKGLVVPLAVGGGIGMLFGGYFGAIINANNIEKLEERTDQIEATINHNVDVDNHNIQIAREDHAKLEELVRQNNLLMEKALQETEGKAE